MSRQMSHPSGPFAHDVFNTAMLCMTRSTAVALPLYLHGALLFVNTHFLVISWQQHFCWLLITVQALHRCEELTCVHVSGDGLLAAV